MKKIKRFDDKKLSRIKREVVENPKPDKKKKRSTVLNKKPL